MSSLNLNDYTPDLQKIAEPTGDHLAQCKKVQTLGIIAVILAIGGLCVPFVADIVAFFLAKHALNLSIRKLVPIEYERAAYWAYRISIVGIIWWVVATIRILL